MRAAVCPLLFAGVFALYSLRAAAASPPVATQPALSDRDASILMQLADAEANITAINKALVLTGYKVGLAKEQITGDAKANELMDRRGGGPVPWDQFYGRTAAGFYYHTSGDAYGNGAQLTPIDRPQQFNLIYRANDQQSARAEADIASLRHDQHGLLARRWKHEGDQVALWAELAWDRIGDREISHRPLYRFRLKPADAKADVLRGPILFLRAADAAVAVAQQSIRLDQPGTLADLHQHTKDAYAALLDTVSDAVLADGIGPDQQQAAEALKALCKQIDEECGVAESSFQQALFAERAKEDASKLGYRGQLQASLAKLSGLVGDLDDTIMKTAALWGAKPDIGAVTADKVPVFPPRSAVPVAGDPFSTPTPTQTPGFVPAATANPVPPQSTAAVPPPVPSSPVRPPSNGPIRILAELPLRDDVVPAGAEKLEPAGVERGATYTHVSPTGGMIYGFNFELAEWARKPVVQTFQPLYDPPRPGDATDRSHVVGRPGYAVSGLTVEHDGLFVTAVKITYARIAGSRLDMNDSYDEAWVGRPMNQNRQELSGSGVPVIGVYGKKSLDISSLGIVLARQ